MFFVFAVDAGYMYSVAGSAESVVTCNIAGIDESVTEANEAVNAILSDIFLLLDRASFVMKWIKDLYCCHHYFAVAATGWK
jgi:hypothetical protein